MPGKQVRFGKVGTPVRYRPTNENGAVVAQQADGSIRAKLECPVEVVEVVAVDRGGQHAGKTAVRLADALREQDRGPPGEARLQRLTDAQLLSRGVAVMDEVSPIGVA